MIVSFFSGLIAGIPAGIVILRSFIAAVLFGLLGLGIWYVIQKFLPEIESLDTDPQSPAKKSSDVDIVIPATNPHLNTDTDGIIEIDGESEVQAAEEAESGDGEETPIQEQGDTENGIAVDSTVEDGGDAKAIQEALPASHETTDAEKNGVQGMKAEEPDGGDSNKTAKGLPDFDSVENAFSTPLTDEADEVSGDMSNDVADDSITDSSMDSGASLGSGTIDIKGTEQDPSTVAKALRTMMNKD